MSEAMKCLCNIIFNSPRAQELISKNHSLEGIVKELQTYKDPELPHDIKFFSMKMLFLITALCEGVTPELKNELLLYLIDILDLILKEVGGMRGDDIGAASTDTKITMPVSMLLMYTMALFST
jgi:hypothetical protein